MNKNFPCRNLKKRKCNSVKRKLTGLLYHCQGSPKVVETKK